ncbi:MAG: beta-N-acetylhexosaminidase [Pseudonocardiales bacterium]|nr:beta-N-acetylhexosaminidase [Pseudonocardiales bacterium]
MRAQLIAAAVLLLAACTSSAQNTQPTGPSHSTPRHHRTHSPAPTTDSTRSTPHSTPTTPTPPTTSPVSPATLAQRLFDRMSEAQRVGQLLMVDCPTTSVGSATISAITVHHVGSVILDGNSFAGLAATQGVTNQLQRLAPDSTGLFIATDQEGGLVQRLQGPGFTRIVSAVQQGTIAPRELERFARGWGNQLHDAGVNVNLAPVLDTVPANFGSNPPIGDLDREFGHTPAVVTAHGLAVLRGMLAAGVDPTVKHFPGLGRTTGNTDTTGGVVDSVTTRDDPYLGPFRAAIAAGTPFVMMSTAIYSNLDPGTPAAFSRPIVTGLLRDAFGFSGLVISDDVGGAAQVASYGIGERAVRFIAAGGDVVLTVDANQAGPMTAALLAKAGNDPAFKRLVDAAALRVLEAKQVRGLLG